MDALRVAQRPSPCDGPLGPFPVGGLRQVHNQRVYDNLSHKIVRISSGLDCPLALTNTSYFLFSMELSQLDTLGANGGYGPDCEVTRDHRNPYILQIQSGIPDIVHNVSYAKVRAPLRSPRMPRRMFRISVRSCRICDCDFPLQTYRGDRILQFRIVVRF